MTLHPRFKSLNLVSIFNWNDIVLASYFLFEVANC